jgi:hypothetical protein
MSRTSAPELCSETVPLESTKFPKFLEFVISSDIEAQ